MVNWELNLPHLSHCICLEVHLGTKVLNVLYIKCHGICVNIFKKQLWLFCQLPCYVSEVCCLIQVSSWTWVGLRKAYHVGHASRHISHHFMWDNSFYFFQKLMQTTGDSEDLENFKEVQSCVCVMQTYLCYMIGLLSCVNAPFLLIYVSCRHTVLCWGWKLR